MLPVTYSGLIAILTALIVLPAVALAAPVPDTGQWQSYTDTFGEDSDYSCNPHSYTDLGNGVVKDNVTGLEWQQTTDTSYSTWSWGMAINYCNNLSLGGKDDWRLPTIKELATLVDFSTPYSYYGPTINKSYFPETRGAWYFSSTKVAIPDQINWTKEKTWLVDFSDGNVTYCGAKCGDAFVRAVRGGQSTNYFIDNGDGTISESNTGLMWQKATAPGTYTWEQAVTYCKNLTLSARGYSDWRLPSLDELQSIVDSRYDPAIDATFFPGTVASIYWSSTHGGCISCARYVDFNHGSEGYGYNNNNYYVRAVRGGQPNYSFVNNNDGTISDTNTGLMWQKATAPGIIGSGDYPYPDQYTWEQALTYCENLTLPALPAVGYSDWRLPNRNEQQSIVDYSTHDPAIDATFFPDTAASYPTYWSSTYPRITYVHYPYDSRYVRCVRGGQCGPAISQTPISGPPGTPFTQRGTGFTPYGTATLHFKKPEGNEYPTQTVNLDNIGHFETTYTAPMDKPIGMYTWWGIDDTTGMKSNEVSYEITELITGSYNFANIENKANEFQLWFDFTASSDVPIDVCKNYNFEIEPTNGMQVIQKDCNCVPQNSKWTIWFEIDPDLSQPYPYPAYFEDAKIKICDKGLNKACVELDGLGNVSVYGTLFDIKKHAWKFANDFLNFTPTSDVMKEAEIITSYAKEDYRSDFYKFFFIRIPHKIFGIGPYYSTNFKINGACYGMVHSAIANFTHYKENATPADVWGTAEYSVLDYANNFSNLHNELISHWEKCKNHDINGPYKTFQTNKIYDAGETYSWLTKWTFQSAKKIMYYVAAQPAWKDKGKEDTWIGKDFDGCYDDSHIDDTHSAKDYAKEILKSGSPVSFGINYGDGRAHKIAEVELISWKTDNNQHDKHILWDVNQPYDSSEKVYGPYLEWYVDKEDGYSSSCDKQKIKPINAINKSTGNGDTNIHKATEVSFLIGGNNLSPTGDSQNIYNMWQTRAASPSLVNYRQLKQKTANAELSIQQNSPLNNINPNYIEVLLIGAKIDAVYEKDSGTVVNLIPNGEITNGQSVILTSGDGVSSLLLLPAEKTYRLNATKIIDCFILKVFASIPNSDGTLEKINYEDFGNISNDTASIEFFVGRANADKGVRMTSQSSQSTMLKIFSSSTIIYNPTYNNTLQPSIEPPNDLIAIYNNGMVNLSWQSVVNPNLAGVRIVRKEGSAPVSSTDGTVIYAGNAETAADTNVITGTIYYYAAFSFDNNYNYSSSANVIVNTTRFSIYGKFTSQTGEGIAGGQLELRDESGTVIGAGTSRFDGSYIITGLDSKNYVLTASHPTCQIQNPARNITLTIQNDEENFMATPVPAVILLFDLSEINIGDSVMLQWAYRNIDNGEKVNIELNRGGNLETIASELPIISGNFTWTVGGAACENAVLRISLSGDSSVYAEHGFGIISESAPTVIKLASFTASPLSSKEIV